MIGKDEHPSHLTRIGGNIMSPINSGESIILAVTHNNNDINIRVDRNGFALSSFEGASVVELMLKECRSAARLYDGDLDTVYDSLGPAFVDLTDSVGQPLYYKILKEADEFIITLQINYFPNELRFYCAQTSETPSDYTIEELKHKTTRLSQLYQASIQASELESYTYRLLKYSLVTMIRKEIDRYERKIEFIGRTNPEKAATLTGQIQAYQKVLTHIGLGDADGKPLESQVRVWLQSMSFDDGDINNQTAHAKSMEKKIASFGQAAIPPLLEVIKYGNQGFRREVLIILGMVDPGVQERIMDILQWDNADIQ